MASIASNSDKTLEALKKLDLIVVDDLFMTASAEVADIILPAATFLEGSCLVKCPGAGPSPTADTSYVGMIKAVVEPLGECKSDIDFIFELGRRLGYGEYFTSPEALFDEELAPLGLTAEKLMELQGGWIKEHQPSEMYMDRGDMSFKTPTGKVELHSETLEEMGYDPLPRFVEPTESPYSTPELAEKYPLVGGVSLHLGLFTHTQYRELPWLREIYPRAFVEINPETAEGLGVADGDEVYVESPRDRIRVASKLTSGIDPRVVSVAWGWGQPYAFGDLANVVTDDGGRCPVSGSTGNRSFLCRVVKAEGA
jgi:anaerobic selenocysteine-containing dehydrogenase